MKILLKRHRLRHIVELEQIFRTTNYSPSYKNYPTMLYHGYHE